MHRRQLVKSSLLTTESSYLYLLQTRQGGLTKVILELQTLLRAKLEAINDKQSQHFQQLLSLASDFNCDTDLLALASKQDRIVSEFIRAFANDELNRDRVRNLATLMGGLFKPMVTLTRGQLEFRLCERGGQLPAGYHVATLNELVCSTNWSSVVGVQVVCLRSGLIRDSEVRMLSRDPFTDDSRDVEFSYVLATKDHEGNLDDNIKALMIRYRNYFI
ncbi:hypothetical protein HDU81_008592 [Chytriomyces hyalinus]|nr:hypothetical protein HDU81_008592 [Chytriomyces hyalinus]